MKPSEAIKGKAEEIRRLIEAYGLVSPMLFGSTARADDQDGSDLDLLATIPLGKMGQISLFDIADLESELQALTGVPVDLNIHNNMPEHLREAIESEMIEL